MPTKQELLKHMLRFFRLQKLFFRVDFSDGAKNKAYLKTQDRKILLVFGFYCNVIVKPICGLPPAYTYRLCE